MRRRRRSTGFALKPVAFARRTVSAGVCAQYLTSPQTSCFFRSTQAAFYIRPNGATGMGSAQLEADSLPESLCESLRVGVTDSESIMLRVCRRVYSSQARWAEQACSRIKRGCQPGRRPTPVLPATGRRPADDQLQLPARPAAGTRLRQPQAATDQLPPTGLRRSRPEQGWSKRRMGLS